MTTDRDKCSLSSFLPMSCRGRAEAFARRLQTRLRSLGSNGDTTVDENTWLTSVQDKPITVSQPKHSSTDSELFFDVDMESPNSPEEEFEEKKLHSLLNILKEEERLRALSKEDLEKNNATAIKSSTSCDSDSSDGGTFYDTSENAVDEQPPSPTRNGVSESSEVFSSIISDNELHESPQEITSPSEDSFFSSASTSTYSSSTLSEDLSTLSLRDEDCITGSTSGPISSQNGLNDEKLHSEIKNGLDNQDEKYISRLTIDKDLTVECSPSQEVTETCDLKIKINDVEQNQSEECTEAEAIELQINNFNENQSKTESEEELEKTPRVRRSSSLKTGKTPPGTPGRKKIVRFADALGLDLADVRTYLDDVPNVPSSAFDDLLEVNLCKSASGSDVSKIQPNKILVALFLQPGGQPNFLDRVEAQCVCLENAIVEDLISLSIAGTVRVRNLDFNKSVYIRYSLDGWKTYADIQAAYVENTCDGFSDKFKFLLYAHTLRVGQRLEFAARFQCKGSQYWDNNNGTNYCFQCLPGSQNVPVRPTLLGPDDYGAHFYYQEETNNVPSQKDEDLHLTHMAVRELVTRTLGAASSPKNKVEPLPIVFILLLSVIFLYLQGAIFIMK